MLLPRSAASWAAVPCRGLLLGEVSAPHRVQVVSTLSACMKLPAGACPRSLVVLPLAVCEPRKDAIHFCTPGNLPESSCGFRKDGQTPPSSPVRSWVALHGSRSQGTGPSLSGFKADSGHWILRVLSRSLIVGSQQPGAEDSLKLG